MMDARFREVWRDRVRNEREAYRRIGEADPFDGWERNAMPEATADRLFTYGCEVLFGGEDDSLGRRFLESALAIRARALMEGKLESPQCRDRFPWNQAKLLEIGELSSAMLGGVLNPENLRQAALGFEEWCSDFTAAEWDSQAQSHWLTAIRLALLADGLEYARTLLRSRRSFRAHPEEREILKGLAIGEGAIDDSTRARIRRYLDYVRDPSCKPSVFLPKNVVRIEVGALYLKLIQAEQKAFDWKDVIRVVGA